MDESESKRVRFSDSETSSQENVNRMDDIQTQLSSQSSQETQGAMPLPASQTQASESSQKTQDPMPLPFETSQVQASQAEELSQTETSNKPRASISLHVRGKQLFPEDAREMEDRAYRAAMSALNKTSSSPVPEDENQEQEDKEQQNKPEESEPMAEAQIETNVEMKSEGVVSSLFNEEAKQVIAMVN